MTHPVAKQIQHKTDSDMKEQIIMWIWGLKAQKPCWIICLYLRVWGLITLNIEFPAIQLLAQPVNQNQLAICLFFSVRRIFKIIADERAKKIQCGRIYFCQLKLVMKQILIINQIVKKDAVVNFQKAKKRANEKSITSFCLKVPLFSLR